MQNQNTTSNQSAPYNQLPNRQANRRRGNNDQAATYKKKSVAGLTFYCSSCILFFVYTNIEEYPFSCTSSVLFDWAKKNAWISLGCLGASIVFAFLNSFLDNDNQTQPNQRRNNRSQGGSKTPIALILTILNFAIYCAGLIGWIGIILGLTKPNDYCYRLYTYSIIFSVAGGIFYLFFTILVFIDFILTLLMALARRNDEVQPTAEALNKPSEQTTNENSKLLNQAHSV